MVRSGNFLLWGGWPEAILGPVFSAPIPGISGGAEFIQLFMKQQTLPLTDIHATFWWTERSKY